MILVTGTGRCGSTALMQVLCAAGLRPLPEVLAELPRRPRHGLEGRALPLSKAMAARRRVALPGPSPTPQSLSGPLPAGLEDEVRGLDAEVLKSPDAGLVLDDWLRLRPETSAVVVCLREKWEQVLGYWGPASGVAGALEHEFMLGRVFGAIARRRVPHAVLLYPRWIDDFEELRRPLRPRLPARISDAALRRAWEASADPARVTR